jgi:hypothetical protein
MTLNEHPEGNYRFLSGIAPYSSGVIAMPGFEIIRVRLQKPLAVDETVFESISQYLSEAGRPIHALCSMEFRIPEPLSFEGFKAFNNSYQQMLQDRDLLLGEVNPIARTNISPSEFDLKEPSVYAFSYTAHVKENGSESSFIVAGAGDISDQADLSVSAIVRPNETSLDALEEKVGVVMDVMQERISGLGVDWDEVSKIDVYSTIPLKSVLVNSILKRIGPAGLHGLNWYYSNPPIQGLIYEMDMRGIRKELIAAM